ncbi:hypothetical protein [Terracoccus sp. 273MFTsu3.1]|uniref:hypothetical protein n=1 Tax=Terracoccus sp. 273MFTsu3.1 TaxID=1172188 RepID=UPI00035C5975|nr:hypothetical protein [Terracoccus sp. 273MFTsu3.1]
MLVWTALSMAHGIASNPEHHNYPLDDMVAAHERLERSEKNDHYQEEIETLARAIRLTEEV